jgi:glycerol-3-phosphate O-acyltransferase/dihydroxyacetone phosphate acyltransferase
MYIDRRLTYRMKRLVAAWRVLLGVWAPRKWDMSVTALSPYTTIQPPPPNPWIDRPKTPTPTPESEAPPAPRIKRKRPASRRLIRHVLRARLNAAHSLVAFLNEIDKAGVKVRSASHLALAHGGGIDGGHGPNPEDGPQGWRYGKEVVEFLRKRGAKIHRLKEPTAGDWAANTSDEEAEELLDVKGGVHSDTDAK